MFSVFNAGYPGDNTRQLLLRFEKDVRSYEPDCVVLMAGTNDFLNSHNLISSEEYRNNILQLISQCRETGTRVILCGIPDANETLMLSRHKPGFFMECSARKRIASCYAILQEIADTENLPFLNTVQILGKATCEKDSLFRNELNSGAADGVHPTPEGYTRLAAAVCAEIRKLTPHPRRIVCLGDSITYGVHVKGAGTVDINAENYPGKLRNLLSKEK